MLGVLNSCDVRSALQILTLQLQMAKIFPSPSMFVTWCTKPWSSAFLRMAIASS